LSKQVMHKFKSDAIRLGISSQQEAIRAVHDFQKKFTSKNMEGILAQPMIFGGVEMIIGFKRDPSVGNVYMLGLGGIFTEEIQDIAIHVGVIQKNTTALMLRQLKSQQTIKSIDTTALSNALMKVQKLVEQKKSICELDLNPIVVFKKGAKIVDARILV